MSGKESQLAICLFESIDDQNISNLEFLLEKHNANPNAIIPKLGIAAIHYAVGFEDLEFAEKSTLMLLKRKADPNVPSQGEMLTPLHISCIWGREKIVKMLLEFGGDLDMKCKDNQSAISYAIHENHYNVVDTIKKFVFEQKMEKKKKDLLMKSKLFAMQKGNLLDSAVKNRMLEKLEEKKFTPNRINYNFDVTSPYYINITHRKHKTSSDGSQAKKELNFSRENENETKDEVEMENKSEDVECNKRNLFELTERNLKEFSKHLNEAVVINRLAIHKRKSYIREWQENIRHIRRSDLKLDLDYINYLHTCNDVSVTKKIDEIKNEPSSDEESFVTAENNLKRAENVIKVPKNEIIEVVEEDYIHSDAENGVIFYERKLMKKENFERKFSNKIENGQSDYGIESDTTISTQVTVPPLDYDTDVLRKELKNLTGHTPVITKSTKQLYLKKMVKLKRKPEISADEASILKAEFSVDLQRALMNFEAFDKNLIDWLQLETKMSQHFIERSNVKWREGNLKTSFIYFLIDPRISDNLPMTYKEMSRVEVWQKFLTSIFYVGKGKRSRPYNHLYDAIKLFSRENDQIAQRLENRRNHVIEKKVNNPNVAEKKSSTKSAEDRFADSKKIAKIIDIWKSKNGVVCLHTFNNIMPVEAYTREAAIIEAIDIENLSNIKRGEYYGLAKNFSTRQKRQLGIALLSRALHVYLAEGESQLMPFDIL